MVHHVQCPEPMMVRCFLCVEVHCLCWRDGDLFILLPGVGNAPRTLTYTRTHHHTGLVNDRGGWGVSEVI